ncbi:PLP-dependent aminotransferase family protein [Thioalkalicoccus limnaeus]|uniref:PLP-dependent aminotransferase family protein n=1 Tax=Thioalkalicoccus limnaeus TaxID=120681 RepID=A0ABV4BIZ5_9GAMM
MQLSIRVDPDAPHSLQQQLFDTIRRLILDGRLRPGSAMPGSRAFSEQLGVSRNTVLLVYERLIAEGYLQTRPAVGTFVNRSLPEQSLCLPRNPVFASPEPTARAPRFRSPRVPIRAQAVVNPNRHRLAIDFWVGRPDPHTFPTKAWRRRLLHHLSIGGQPLTEYGDPSGLSALRRAIADYLGPARGINTGPERIVIVAGIQQALNIAARLLVHDGATVVLECPCYQGAAYVFEHHGAHLRPVPVDEHGLMSERLPATPVSLAYVTPSHQYPLGGTLSLERRIRLLEWAEETGAYIVEDDYDSDFRHAGSPLTAVAGLDPQGGVIYLGTFSKSIGAGLRLGYMVLPEELVEPARTLKALLDNGNPWLDQAVLADFIASGSYDRHLRRIRQLYRRRRDCLVESLRAHFGAVRLSGLEGGMHAVWHLPTEYPSAPELQALALEAGVGVYALDGGGAIDFDRTNYRERTLLLGYSSLSETEIREGVARLARAFNGPNQLRTGMVGDHPSAAA